MNARSNNSLTQPAQNPLATIFFIFGALHVYSAVKSKKRNNLQPLEMGLKIVRPVLIRILGVALLGTTFVEAMEILEISLH